MTLANETETPKLNCTISSEVNQEIKMTDEKKQNTSKEDRSKNTFTIPLCGSFKISIYKPLVLFKLAQFTWFGAGSYLTAFLTVYLKQRGVSLSQLSWMNIIAPIVQLTGTAISGIVADKIGKSKPVLIANILLVTSVVVGVLLMPSMKTVPCNALTFNFSCPSLLHNEQDNEQKCAVALNSCYVECLETEIPLCDEYSPTCSMKLHNHNNISNADSFNETIIYNGSCYVVPEMTRLIIYDWCHNLQNRSCQLSCSEITNSSRKDVNEVPESAILFGYITLYVLFVTFFSNVYRCFDITSMTLTQEHNSDFGHERFFGMAGNLVISPLAGLITDATTVPGGPRNYSAAFYLFLGLVVIALIVLHKLPVTVNPPSKQMGIKTLRLLKNPDILVLMVVVLVLGTAWNFTKVFVFWYLEDLNASSVLMGLVPSISAAYGLPFLLTSSWWVKKIDSRYIIIISFIGYVFMCIGFSFLINPWYTLVIEVFGGVTYYLLWVAVVTYCHELAPEGMKASVVAIAGAIHFSIGKTTGGLLGGLVMNSFGGRIAFRVIAITCFVTAVFYGVYLRLRYSYVTKKHKLTVSSKKFEMEKQLNGIFIVQKNAS